MGWNCVFDICDVKVVVFDLAFFDEVICYAGDVVAVVDVGQLYEKDCNYILLRLPS